MCYYLHCNTMKILEQILHQLNVLVVFMFYTEVQSFILYHHKDKIR